MFAYKFAIPEAHCLVLMTNYRCHLEQPHASHSITTRHSRC